MAEPPPRSVPVSLIAVIALASALRFAGLAYEVRHPQHDDDRVFVNNVIAMLEAGDLDHRYYEYPGLFFYLLALPIALGQPERIDDPAAYLAARILVASFGVVSVALIYVLGRRLAGPVVGLSAALLLAVSPHEVAASHTNRPDIVLQTLTLAGYLSLLGLGRRWSGDLRAALWLGLGTGIKFTGFLLFPSYVLARLRAPGPRLVRIALVAGLAALIVLAVTPYALFHPRAYTGGVTHQMGAHYVEPLLPATYLDNVATYTRWLTRPLGLPVVVLAGLGAALVLYRPRPGWLPVLVHMPVTVLVMASAGILAPRFLIPASGGVLLAAGFGIGAVARERRWVALALAVVAAAMPLRASFDRLPPLLEPSPRDAGLDWIEANLPSGSRILETRAYADPGLRAQLLGVDPRRYEMLFRSSAQGGLRLLAPHMDLVITGPEGGIRWSQDLRAVFKAEGVGSHGFVLKVPARRARPRYRRLTAQGLSLDASANRDGLAALLDGDRDTVWSSSRSVAPGDWIEVHLEKPQPIARLELWVGQRPSREPQLEILAIDADRNLNARFAVAARAPVERQPAAVGRSSQVFLLEPELVTGLRIRITDAAPEPWSLADLELFVRVPATPTP